MEVDRDNRVLQLWRGQVLPEWLDYNGHMTEHRYLQAFGESSDALYGRIGVDFADAVSGAFFTLTTFITHIAECKIGTGLYSETEILGHDPRLLHLFHRLFEKSPNSCKCHVTNDIGTNLGRSFA